MTPAGDQLTETAAVRTDLRGALGVVAALDTGAPSAGAGVFCLVARRSAVVRAGTKVAGNLIKLFASLRTHNLGNRSRL